METTIGERIYDALFMTNVLPHVTVFEAALALTVMALAIACIVSFIRDAALLIREDGESLSIYRMRTGWHEVKKDDRV